MNETFQKYPNLEIFADPLDPVYRVKYTECVKERGVVRFEKREARVSREALEALVGEIVMVSALIHKAELRG
jgi:hypothetical protein